MHAYVDTHNHKLKELLSLNTERFPRGLNSTGSLLISDAGPNVTVVSLKSRGPTLTKAGSTRAPRLTKASSTPEFIWGKHWNYPGTSTQPLTPDKMDQMVLV
jgi:hypothetical protein